MCTFFVPSRRFAGQNATCPRLHKKREIFSSLFTSSHTTTVPKKEMNNASVSSKSLLFVVFALFGISFARAADQVVTWKYEAQEISLYSDESLTIQWTGTHDVWLDTTSAECDSAGAVEQKSATANDNWTTMAGTMSPGTTYYLSCRVGSHCESGMTLKVTALAGSRPTSDDDSSGGSSSSTSSSSSARVFFSTRNAFAFALAASGAALAALV